MPCFTPLNAYRSRHQDENGKRPIIFYDQKNQHEPIKLPCGQCIGCRLERSRQWAMRCLHEADIYENNCFITLTFNEDALMARPNPASLDHTEFQKFMKRLRKKYVPKNPHDPKTLEYEQFREKHAIRFYMCGEYGEENRRPHYHACLFNFDFPDKQLWKIENDNRLYISDSLQSLWSCPKSKKPLGFCTIGDVTFESAAYVARYILKKVNGQMAENHYNIICPETGCVLEERIPEYTNMSRRNGIGREWYNKYKNEVYPHDRVVVRGIECKPPKYYDRILEQLDPYTYDEIKEKRLTQSKNNALNNTSERLHVREQVKNAQLNQLTRKL